MMLQQLQYDSYVGGEVLERRDTHYVGSVFLVVIFRSTICQNQHRLGSVRLVTISSYFTNGGEIWHGGGDRAKFHPHRCNG